MDQYSSEKKMAVCSPGVHQHGPERGMEWRGNQGTIAFSWPELPGATSLSWLTVWKLLALCTPAVGRVLNKPSNSDLCTQRPGQVIFWFLLEGWWSSGSNWPLLVDHPQIAFFHWAEVLQVSVDPFPGIVLWEATHGYMLYIPHHSISIPSLKPTSSFLY